MKNNKIIIGKVLSVYGLKGYFKGISYCKCHDDFFSFKGKHIIDNEIVDIQKCFIKKSILICKSKQINTVEQAESIVKKNISIREKYITPVTSGEYYYKDLVGCNILNNKKEILGKIKAVHNFGAGDLLELDSKFPYMIKLADIEEKDIGLNNKRIIVKLYDKEEY